MYVITIQLENVSDGDATDLAQQIYDEHGEALDADRGEFRVAVSHDGFALDWEPEA